MTVPNLVLRVTELSFTLLIALTDKISVDQCDIVSDSSGVGTSNSGSGGSYDANTPSEHSLVLPGMTVVCTEAYSCKEPNHLNLQPGDIIEGIASSVVEGTRRLLRMTYVFFSFLL